MRQSERPFCFSNFETKKKSGFSHVKSGNRNTPRFGMKNWDIPIKSG